MCLHTHNASNVFAIESRTILPQESVLLQRRPLHQRNARNLRLPLVNILHLNLLPNLECPQQRQKLRHVRRRYVVELRNDIAHPYPPSYAGPSSVMRVTMMPSSTFSPSWFARAGVTSAPVSPISGLTTRPCSMRLLMIGCAAVELIANPIPWARRIIAVLMPITSP